LRHGAPKQGYNRAKSVDIMVNTPMEYFLEAMSASLNGTAAEDKNWKINLIFSDTGESFVLWIENAVLHHRKIQPAADANATLTLTKPLFLKMLLGKSSIKDTLFSNDLKIGGSKTDLVRFFALFDKAYAAFPIVTPK
jgi:alkyl sulfatase BDS1-like metallo-beta-lactamase superfamily hydrolase